MSKYFTQFEEATQTIGTNLVGWINPTPLLLVLSHCAMMGYFLEESGRGDCEEKEQQQFGEKETCGAIGASFVTIGRVWSRKAGNPNFDGADKPQGNGEKVTWSHVHRPRHQCRGRRRHRLTWCGIYRIPAPCVPPCP